MASNLAFTLIVITFLIIFVADYMSQYLEGLTSVKPVLIAINRDLSDDTYTKIKH